jgi:PHP family Zn ribbon phosphoesterase
MSRFYYDLHLHSCLSPCGDDEMTPGNIAGMGKVAELDIMALTDHNTCRNCPAFFAQAEANGIVPVPGMELTTAEDIHIVCLFPSLESALAFEDSLQGRRILIENRPDIFGRQLIMDENDCVSGEEKYMLPNALNISIDEVPAAVDEYGGVCYPAHIDREAKGIIAVLGTLPETPDFTCAEIKDREKDGELKDKYPALRLKTLIHSSDAHYLWDINGRENYIDIDAPPDDFPLVRQRLIERLKQI